MIKIGPDVLSLEFESAEHFEMFKAVTRIYRHGVLCYDQSLGIDRLGLDAMPEQTDCVIFRPHAIRSE